MLRVICAGALLAASLFAEGCVSVAGRVYGTLWGHPYAGTTLALAYAGVEPALCADAPFDFILDTAFHPVDLALMPFVEQLKL